MTPSAANRVSGHIEDGVVSNGRHDAGTIQDTEKLCAKGCVEVLRNPHAVIILKHREIQAH